MEWPGSGWAFPFICHNYTHLLCRTRWSILSPIPPCRSIVYPLLWLTQVSMRLYSDSKIILFFLYNSSLLSPEYISWLITPLSLAVYFTYRTVRIVLYSSGRNRVCVRVVCCNWNVVSIIKVSWLINIARPLKRHRCLNCAPAAMMIKMDRPQQSEDCKPILDALTCRIANLWAPTGERTKIICYADYGLSWHPL